MTDYKINLEIQKLLKMGIHEDMAHVIAYANAGRFDDARKVIDQMGEEQDLISDELRNFVPFGIPIRADDSDTGDDECDEKLVKIKNKVVIIDDSNKQDQESDLQHQLESK